MEAGSSSRTVVKPIDVLMVGFGNDYRTHETLIRNVGGNNVNVKIAKNVKEALELHKNMNTYDLIIFMKVDKKDGTKLCEDLIQKVYKVKSMVVGVTTVNKYMDKSIAWTEAGVNHCLVEPLTEEKLTTVFTKFKAGSYKKMVRVLSFGERFSLTFFQREELYRDAGAFITSVENAESPMLAMFVYHRIVFDIIYVPKVSMIKWLREKWPRSIIVGVAGTREDLEALSKVLPAGLVFWLFPAVDSKIRELVKMVNL
ncbi:unnamed protein product [Cochlearia groenlandica]